MHPLIKLDQAALSRFEEAIKKEWLITNGLGGYASSTVLGLNTRKYHGLLVAALHPPTDRRVCLAKLDEEVCVGNNVYPLGATEFQNTIFPQGFLSLKEFSLTPFPKNVYEVQKIKIEKTVFMPHEKNAVIVLYKILNANSLDARIRISPLVNGRGFHSVTERWKTQQNPTQRYSNAKLHISFNQPQSTMIVVTTGGRYEASEKWIERIYYREEAARGESCLDDCYQTGFFEMEIQAKKHESFAIVAVADSSPDAAEGSLNELPASFYDLEALYEKEMKRRERLLEKLYEKHVSFSRQEWLSWLVLATDAFIVKAADLGKSVIAGYHWFECWGRDAFISLPGLMLVTGRIDDARSVFLSFKQHLKQGLIPNFIAEPSTLPAYNSVDASLWFVNAVFQYLKYTGDFSFVQEHLWEAAKAIIENYVKGTMFNISLDSDGLLIHGSQLTWMDAAVDGKPVTARDGKAVEVQALWYNALKVMELLARKFEEPDEAARYRSIAAKTRKSFSEKFWNAEKKCLYDTVEMNRHDDSLRPNQIIAIALDFTMLEAARNESIVDTVHRELFTPFGLRSLAKGDPRYVGIYAGDRRFRDKAYHNGTAWSWLLGPFTTAYLKVKGSSDFRREYAFRNFLLPFFTAHISDAGLGNASEIFDGDPPHRPKGCIAQAWSVAEPLRAYTEDVMQIRPKYEKQLVNMEQM
ncbi:glycogen debranching enzyme family protein [Candidatus Bathyarchaeota archaeon]|nr:glycogen debranching enzyme family protein [Candidatus Bathyarchaeota archaeon]